MQFIKNIKYISLIILILSFSLPVLSQEDTSDGTEISTDSVSVKKERKFKLFSFFKKKNKEETEVVEEDIEENDEISDSTETKKKKFKLFSFLKRKNKNDSISNDSISSDSTNIVNDSIETKEKFSWFKKNKKDSAGGVAKPDRIKMRTWNNMNAEEQDSVFKAWDAYDKEFYKKKFAFTKKEVEVAIKKKRNPWERLIYNRARKKPFKHKKKLITRQNRRYQKTLRYERIKKSETAPSDSISDTRKYKIVNKQYKRGAKREAIRKNKVVLKYDKKEDKLRRKYELSDHEKMLLNKGRAIRLKGAEKITFNKARKKQVKFTEKLLNLRQERAFKLQSENVQDRMKKNAKRNKERDKKWYDYLYKKKKKKKYDKLDSDEFPKEYHK